ncbi:putative monovalent cation/H+ antiporter subunit G [Rickettsiales bacterium Ac37b]|nr:putative monovalent cation/H+ antiporter subunit G [Rickettsiales bacterium Ac37b]
MALIGWIFILIGGVFIFSSTIGCMRFPDFLSRLHAAGIGDSCGGPLVIVGLIMQNGLTIFSFKLFLLIIILLITNPTACHILAKSALLSSEDENDV